MCSSFFRLKAPEKQYFNLVCTSWVSLNQLRNHSPQKALRGDWITLQKEIPIDCTEAVPPTDLSLRWQRNVLNSLLKMKLLPKFKFGVISCNISILVEVNFSSCSDYGIPAEYWNKGVWPFRSTSCFLFFQFLMEFGLLEIILRNCTGATKQPNCYFQAVSD